MTRRLRPTLLLRILITVSSLAVFTGFVALLGGRPLGLVLGLVLLVSWFVALELEVLPFLIEAAALRWASRSPQRPSTWWFVDAPAEEALARDRERTAVRNNPALQ